MSYSSAALNGVMGSVQSNYVGSGWSLGGMISIVRKIKSRVGPIGSSDPLRIWEYENTFTLILGGASYNLSGPEKIGASDGCRYYAEDAPQLLVMRYTSPGSQNQLCGYGAEGSAGITNSSLEYWVVTTADGTDYRLGFTADAEQLTRMDGFDPAAGYNTLTGSYWGGCAGGAWCIFGGYAGQAAGRVTYRWSVDRIQDVYGNMITYGYAEEYSTGGGYQWDRAQYPAYIRYTANSLQGTAGPYVVQFILEDRLRAPGVWHDDGLRGETLLIEQRPYAMWDEKRIDRIRVCVNLSANTCPDSNASLAEYDLGYQFVIEEWPGYEWIINTINHETTRLTSITKYGWNAQGQKVALPATTFTYASYNQADNYTDPADGAGYGGKLKYPRLLTVDNGYGGQVTFTYDPPVGLDGVYSYRVLHKDTSDGMGRTARTTYTYTGPCFSRLASGSNCRRSGLEEATYALIGHATTTVDVYDYNSGPRLNRTRYTFITDATVNRGKTTQTQVYNASNQLLQQQDTTWGIRSFGPLGVPAGYVGQTLATDYSSFPAATQRTDFSYDYYGNVIAEYQYGAEEGVVNGGFENGLQGWTLSGANFTTAPTTTLTFAGYASLPLYGSVTGGVYQDIEGLEPGQTYLIRVRVRADSVTTDKFLLRAHDTTGNNAYQLPAFTPSTTEWQTAVLDYEANATGKVRVVLQYSTVGSGRIYVDAVAVAMETDADDERSIHRGYHFNPTVWLVSALHYENLYAGITLNVNGVQLQTLTLYYYDYANDHNTLPTQGRLTKVQRGIYGGPWAFTSYTYDPWGNVTSESDPNSVTAINFDGTYHQFPTEVYRNAGQLCSYTRYYGVNEETRSDDFGLFGQVQKTYDNNGEAATATYSVYDAFGRLVKEIRPGDSFTYPTVEYAYTDAYASGGLQGLRVVTKQREVAGSSAHLSSVAFYDGLGRAVQQRAEYQESATQSVVNTVYDAAGRAVSAYVPESESFTWEFSRPSGWNTRPRTQTAYDTLGRTTVVTATDNTVTRMFYQGRDTMVLDAANRQRFSRVDAYGQLILVREYQGMYTSPNWNASIYATTRYAYDPLGNLLTVTDALNNVTTMSYDVLSRKTDMYDPDMGHWVYTYDNAGNLMQQTDARGCVTTFTYDGLDRLTNKVYSGSLSQCNDTPDVTYTYDAFSSGSNYGRGYRTGMSDTSGGSVTWAYDGRGRVVTETKIINGGGTFKTEWGYDSLDRVTWMKYPSGNTGGTDEQVNYTYAANGALNSVVGVGTSPYVQSTAYDAAGRITQRVLGNPAVLYTTYGYYSWTTPNGQGRLQTLKTGSSAPPNNTSLQQLQYTFDAVGNVRIITDTLAGPQTQTFTYDPLDRLVTAVATGGISGTYTLQNYSYNQIGNLTNNGSGTLTYPASGPNSVRPHAVTGWGSNTYGYDANGNQTTRTIGGSTSTLTYDAENRLTTVSGATSASFVYDGDGNRVKSVMGGVTTYYVGNYYEYVNSSTTKKYYYAGSQRVAMRDSSTLYFLLGDHLGSTSLTANSSGAMVAELRYKPWGETRYTSGTTPTSYQFTGQRNDATGLYFYNARYYDPLLGRFLSADSIVPSPANPQSLNRYAYALNNPLRYTDPTGHLPDEELAKLLGFEDVEQMYASDLWLQLQERYSEFLKMLRSGDFTYGSVLVAEIRASSSHSSIHQLMLARTRAGDPFMWDLDAHQPMGGITLDDLLQSSKWALFTPQNASDLSAGYNLAANAGSGSSGLPKPSFNSSYWGEWNDGPYGKLYVDLPNWQIVAWDVFRLGGKTIGVILGAGAAISPEPFTKAAWYAGLLVTLSDWGKTISEVSSGSWKGSETFVYPNELGSGQFWQ